MTEKQTVNVKKYDPEWPRVYERETNRLGDVFERTVRAVEHVGSTSVPGLSARPVIDVALLVFSDHVSELRNALVGTGSFAPAERREAVPVEQILKCSRSDPPFVHLFLCKEGNGKEFKRLVRFRELLRTDRELARRYETLKQGLARRFHNDPDAYNAEKSAFIHTLEEVYL